LDFNPDDFLARINSDLVGKYVNIASRAAAFITKHFDGRLKYIGGTESLIQGAARIGASHKESYDAREFGKAIRDAMAIADRINQGFDAKQPWVS